MTRLTTVESTVELDVKSGVNATCIASLGGVYKKTSTIHIHPEALATTDPSAVAVAVGRKSQQSMANFAGSYLLLQTHLRHPINHLNQSIINCR